MKYLVDQKTKEHRPYYGGSIEWAEDQGLDIVRADSDGWIAHTGNECPLPDDAKCEVKFGNGVTIIWQPADRCWWNNSAIKAYRPILSEKVQEPEQIPTQLTTNTLDLLGTLKRSHEHAQQIPDLESELREVLAGMGYDLVARSPFVEPEAQGTDAAVKDALIYGTSVMRGGKHIPIQDFYVAPEQTVEPPQDMSDWRNWREGDLLLCVKGGVDLKEGNFYYISTRRHKLCVIDDDDCVRVLGLIDHNFLFHSRPAKGSDMGICYIGFTVQVHGLKIEMKDQVDELRQAIKTAVETVHPARDSSMSSSDVEVEITEYAGQIYEELPEPTEVESRCAIT